MSDTKDTRDQLEEVVITCLSRLDRLQDDLAAALTLYLDPKSPTARPGMIIALGAVSEFIESFPELASAKLHLPLRALSVALTELDAGHTHEALTPTKIWDKRQKSSARMKVMLIGAMALEAEYRRTRDLNSAAETIANLMNEHGFRKTATSGPKGAITAATVIDWRNRLNQGQKVSKREAEIWERNLAELARYTPDEDAAAKLIRNLPHHLGLLGTRNLSPANSE